jgi:murein L,D-transpeptidase YcbB/YkuD
VPHVQKDRGYIAKKGFEVVTPEGGVVTDGSIDDDILARLQAGRLRVRQKPGPANSLGLVKFVFPNEQNVFMHDTDAPELFSRERRDLSPRSPRPDFDPLWHRLRG